MCPHHSTGQTIAKPSAKRRILSVSLSTARRFEESKKSHSICYVAEAVVDRQVCFQESIGIFAAIADRLAVVVPFGPH